MTRYETLHVFKNKKKIKYWQTVLIFTKKKLFWLEKSIGNWKKKTGDVHSEALQDYVGNNEKVFNIEHFSHPFAWNCLMFR